jgi:hypothetical protein
MEKPSETKFFRVPGVASSAAVSVQDEFEGSNGVSMKGGTPKYFGSFVLFRSNVQVLVMQNF